MRHRVFGDHLGRRTNQAKALYRALIRSVLEYGKIETSAAKALAVRSGLEKLIFLAKKDSVHNRRLAEGILGGDGILDRLFENVGPAFADVSSGFTRVIKLGPRSSDSTEMVFLELTRMPVEATPRITGNVSRIKEETERAKESPKAHKEKTKGTAKTDKTKSS